MSHSNMGGGREDSQTFPKGASEQGGDPVLPFPGALWEHCWKQPERGIGGREAWGLGSARMLWEEGWMQGPEGWRVRVGMFLSILPLGKCSWHLLM